jgi:hypothetical protein
MLRWLVALAVSLVIGLGTASAQVPAKKHPQKKGPGQGRTVEQVFQAKDANQDGKLTQEEFMKGVPEARKAAMEKRFAVIDADKDGFITKEELKAAFEKMKDRGGKGKKGGK